MCVFIRVRAVPWSAPSISSKKPRVVCMSPIFAASFIRFNFERSFKDLFQVTLDIPRNLEPLFAHNRANGNRRSAARSAIIRFRRVPGSSGMVEKSSCVTLPSRFSLADG
eukprot:1318338-Amorphochlora_amoeboformis.AAC.1